MNREKVEKTIELLKTQFTPFEYWQLFFMLEIYSQLETMNNWQERHMNMLTSIDEGQNILMEKVEQMQEKLKSLDDATDLIKDRVFDIQENTSK